ncbi:SpoIID/LytB domain-containing protein [Clostridium sp. M62/1]|uniref:SpoIID/LytB domain-containing protein n=1 Tax=Clostridium sp. M62/1 TaxID=411486 RepID=UPI00019738A4|nr:SpoIID/LytB domain-containing protein [Clostridium sp. M62/1]EFE13246.1 SpoIID/LytB domain protein [Clostridium sp. M62/1]UEB77794.1 SpoIID/LytB domain-containing protein [Clostridium sp. M62/1]
MSSKKMVYWTGAVAAAVLLLIILIVTLDHNGNYVSRALAGKALALGMTDRETCEAWEDENESNFPSSLKGQWYVKYLDYLIGNGYMELPGDEDGEERQADMEDFAAGAITYGEVAYAAEQVESGLSRALGVSRKKYSDPIPKEEWWLFYETFLKQADPEGTVQTKTIALYGTPANVEGAESWTAYTSEGELQFEGLSLDAYIDHEIEVCIRGTDIIRMERDVSDEVVYKNAWLIPDGEKNRMEVYIGGTVREFPLEDAVEEEAGGVLADVSLKDGKIRKLSLKKDTIEGKVLAVRDNAIEIEGYGNVAITDDFKVYKTYGTVKEARKKDILVGYDIQKFVVEDKRICAALLVKSFDARNIRVLLMDTGFQSIFHDTVTLKCSVPMKVVLGDYEFTVEAGEKFTVFDGDERLRRSDRRFIIEPEDPTKSIDVTTIERGQGTPSYQGTLEISQEKEGLLLLNDLDVEDYLTRVVPSEMPASYEMEALKAQAVCARTYAYRQIKANAYSQYGAHVDDSTNYQVYNNTASSERTDTAVMETYGQMVFYGDNPAETYYFSTSCGHTTDGTIWGADQSAVPYLKGVSLTDGRTVMKELRDNESFEKFIRDKDAETYDSTFPMYRWETKITNRSLEEKITGIGEIQALAVTERETGGIAKKLKVYGSEGETVISGESQIRSTLGSTELVYKKNDGKTLTGWSNLPSAYIAIDETARDEESGLRTFTIWGGGYGHGVGMSQNGAQQMAREGMDYEDILTFFYDGVEIRELS